MSEIVTLLERISESLICISIALLAIYMVLIFKNFGGKK